MDKKISVTLDIGANISQIRNAAIEAQKILSNIGADPKNSLHLKNMLSDLESELDKLESKSEKALTGLSDTRTISSSIEKVETLIKNIGKEIEKVGYSGETGWAKMTAGLSTKMKKATDFIKEYNTELKRTESTHKSLKTIEDKAIESRNKFSKSRQKTEEKFNQTVKDWSTNNLKYGTSKTAYEKIEKEARTWAEQHKVRLNKNFEINANDAKKLDTEELKEYGKILEQVKIKYDVFNKARSNKETTDTNYQKEKAELKELKEAEKLAEEEVKNAQKAIEDFNKTAKDTTSFENLKKSLSQTFGDETFKNVKNIDELNKKLEKLAGEASGEVKNGLNQILDLMKQNSSQTSEMKGKTDECTNSIRQMGETSREIEHLAFRLKYFFSLAGGFQLMRRAIRSAIDTTKELDEVMTQTAVVSKYTVSDMWKTLPQYSKYAKQLGTAIKDVYSAQTLYVQQGLSMDAAMDLGIETLKMARVANIDAAEATNSMTSALRGFKMELNETSATHINDVYSKLAQNTASNVQEISTAMSKVASLASSANMSFENTAGYLAKIIESTREGAETAGTALKTVIARFTEVKKLYSEGELLGTDEEGQEIDVNKISAALRTVGIDMNKFFVGQIGLDEIFDELGSKWSSLTTVQQRYIATMAAGSRQQSRFLALMQNYNRTVELTNMAYNSAGSGQEQFEKTLESLVAKIEKFKAEWQTFVMGIANSDAVKWFVDTGTTILSVINKIIDAISGGNGLVKSIASIATAFGVFKGGRALLKGTIGGSGTYGLGGIVGNWFGIKNGYAQNQEKVNAFRVSMREGGLRGQRGDYLRTSWFGGSGVLNPKGRLAAIKAEAEAEVAAKYDAYKAAEQKEQQSLHEAERSQRMDREDVAEKAYDQYDKDHAETEARKADYEKAQQDLKGVGTSATDAGTALYQYGQAAKTAGVAAGVAAGACIILANVLDKTGNTKAAKTLRGIGTVLTVLSGIFVVLGQVAQMTGAKIAAGAQTASTAIKSIPIIGWIAAIISALTALGIAIANFVETDEERLERLSEQANTARETAESAAQAYNDLLSSHSDYNTRLDEIKKLIKGTKEYKDAVKAFNDEILKMAGNYSGFKYTYNKNTGLYEVDEEEWSRLEELYENRKKWTQASSIIAAANLDYETKKVNEPKTASSKIGQYYTIAENDIVRLDPFHDDINKLGRLNKYATDEQIQGAYYQAIRKAEEEQRENNLTNYDFSENLQQYYEDELNKVLETLPDDIDYFGEYVDKFATAVLQVTDGSKEANVVTRLSATQLTTYGRDKNVEKTSEWDDNDWGKKSQFEEDNGYDSRWEFMLEQAVKQGIIDGSQYSTYKSDNGETNKYQYGLAAGITGKTATEMEQLGIEYTEEVLGSWYQTQIAAKMVEADEATFKTLAPELQEALTNALLDPNNLNKSQQKLLDTNWGMLFDKETGLFKNADTTEIRAALDNSNWEGSVEIVNSKFYSRSAESMWKNLNKYGEEFSEAYATLFGKIVSNTTLSEKQRAKVLEILNSSDIRNIEDLYKIFGLLKEEGIDLTDVNLDTAFNDFIDKLKDAGIAIKTWSEENFKKNVKSERGLKNQLVSGELEYTWTKEQYEELENLFKNTEYQDLLNDFTENLDGTYTYSASDLDPIISALNSLDKFFVKNRRVDLEQEAKASDEMQKIREAGGIGGIYIGGSSHGGGKEILINKDTTRAEIEGLSEEVQLRFYQKVLEKINDEELLNRLGLPKNISQEDISTYLPKLLDLWFNNEELHNQALTGIGISTGQELINYGYGAGSTEKEQKEANLRLKSSVLVDEEATGLMAKWEENIDDADAAVLALAKDYSTLLKIITKASDAIADQIDNLKAGPKIGSEYYKSLDLTQKALKEVFGVDFNEEWIKNHLPDLEKWSQGSEEAFKTIAVEADKIWQTKLAGPILSTYNSIITQMATAEVDIPVSLNKQSVQATEEQMQALKEALAAQGIEANWKDLGESTDVPGLHNYELKFGVKGSGVGSSKKSGGGGGGKEFKNDFDKYYNMVEDINELERLRNLLETDYSQLLESEAASGKAIYDNLKKQVDLLKERRDITADLAEKRKQQILDEIAKSENQDLSEYAWWNNEDLTIEINWDKINEVKDSELGDRIKDFVKTLEDFQSKYDEQIEALEDIESTLQEIEKRGRDQYTSLEDRVRDALIKRIQDQIDELTATDEGISTANQKLLDSIQNTLDKQRQERDNAKTEEELSDKEQRLAYLRQDSSNANALEIVQLEKELADERQSYTDQLIDQKISELQEQNDEAAEQRQEQIDLLQQSLDWQEKNGEFWEQAYQLMNNGIGPDGTLVTGSELEQLLKQGEGWQALSQEGKMNWLSELETMVAEAVGYLYLSRQLEKIGTKAGTEITFTDVEGNTHTGKVDKDGNVVIDNGDGTQTVWKDVYQSYDGSYRTLETEENAKTENKPATSTKPGGSGSGGSSGPGDSSGNTETWENIGNKSYHDLNNSEHEIWQDQKSSKGHFRTQKTREAHNNYKRIDTGNTQTCYCDKCGHYMGIISKTGGASSSGNGGDGTGLDNKVMTRYATGGLNTKTGPAWLDGTPSRPELILSARDTENFIQLKDTLADLRKNSASLGINGDNYYEISINVDEIGSDYDVDKLADRLRTLIYRDSQYRNVNTLNRLR